MLLFVSAEPILPGIRSDPLVWIIYQLSSLHLVERSIGKVVSCDFSGHPIPPVQAEAALEEVPHHEDGDAQKQGSHPLGQHLVKAVNILLAEGIEEVSTQKVEQDTAEITKSEASVERTVKYLIRE